MDLARAVALQRRPKPGPLTMFNTQLSATDEAKFRRWKAKYAPRDSGFDYDLRGAFSAGIQPDPISGHWPDTFKKPNHPTFSNESRYAAQAPAQAGYWSNGRFIPMMAFGS